MDVAKRTRSENGFSSLDFIQDVGLPSRCAHCSSIKCITSANEITATEHGMIKMNTIGVIVMVYSPQLQALPTIDASGLETLKNLIDRVSGCVSMVALTLPSAAKARLLRSKRRPTMSPGWYPLRTTSRWKSETLPSRHSKTTSARRSIHRLLECSPSKLRHQNAVRPADLLLNLAGGFCVFASTDSAPA